MRKFTLNHRPGGDTPGAASLDADTGISTAENPPPHADASAPDTNLIGQSSSKKRSFAERLLGRNKHSAESGPASGAGQRADKKAAKRAILAILTWVLTGILTLIRKAKQTIYPLLRSGSLAVYARVRAGWLAVLPQVRVIVQGLHAREQDILRIILQMRASGRSAYDRLLKAGRLTYENVRHFHFHILPRWVRRANKLLRVASARLTERGLGKRIGQKNVFRIFQAAATTSVIILATPVAIGAWYSLGQVSGGVYNYALVGPTPPRSSYIVATLADSLDKLLDDGWCPSSSYFLSPSHFQVDQCAFDEGSLQLIRRVTKELLDTVSREGSTSSVDPNLAAAFDSINRASDIWSFFPQNDSSDRYGAAVVYLRAYNQDLADGKALLDPRIETLSKLVAGIKSVTGAEFSHMQNAEKEDAYTGAKTRYDYYHAAGVDWVTCLTMRAMQRDFERVAMYQTAGDFFKEQQDQFCGLLGVKPWPVINAGRGSATYNNFAMIIRELTQANLAFAELSEENIGSLTGARRQ